MSKEIDERIISLEFDNKNFEKNVRSSMSTLDKLKQSLNFKGATKGLEAVDTAAKKVNFTPLANAVDTIGVRFNAMQVIATTALANITNGVVNAGKQMLNSFAIQPITSGFQEYETQIGSIQTILSNTRWQNTSLEQVNSALDQLNTYADQTIYNFTEMTRNIGTFTAAGVGLDQSVAAIKGIANLAAVSGSSSQQASTAMYQLSQALAAGKVSLMDWNSVVNAGMGGKVFQDALVRTSELMGTGAKQAIETYGTFRESLTEGQWLTTDVLTETLKQISGAYTEADLISQGYTQEQAAEIVALANDATNAATKVRTFTQLMDTTMEALGSGWTNTWEILVGDFEEATEFWSGISSVINNAVTESANARNELLQQWVDMGGRQNILDGLTAALEGLNNILQPIKEAFSSVFPPITAQTLLDISNNFKNLMNQFKAFSSEAAPVVKDVFTAIFSVLKAIGSVIGSVVSGIGEFFSVITSSGGNIGSIVSKLSNFVTTAANAITESGALTGVLTVLGNAFGNVLGAITNLLTGGVSKLGEMFSGIGDILGGAADIIVTAISNITSGLGDILGTADFGSLIDVFNSGMLASLVVAVRTWFEKLTGGVEESSSGLFDVIKDMVGGISENVTGVLDSVRGSLETWQTNIKTDILLKIAVAVVALVAAIAVLAAIDPDRLKDALGAITVLFAELIGSMTLFTKLNTNLEQLTGIGTMIAMATAIAILASAMKGISDLNPDQLAQGIAGIAGLATVMVAVSKALSRGGDISKGAVQLILMAAAIKVLASVVNDLSSLNVEQLTKGIVSISALMASMAIFSRTVKAEGLIKVSAAMIVMAAGLEILTDVVSKFGSMPIEQIVQGLITVAAAISEFAILMRIFPKGTTIVKAAAGIYILAMALEALVPAMQGFAGLGIEGAAVGIAAIAGILGAMSGLMVVMGKMDVFRLGASVGALNQMSDTFEKIANAVNNISQLSVTGIVQSLVSLSVAFGLMMGMMVLMSRMDVGDVASITVTMPALAGSLSVMADAINKIGNMNLENAAAATITLVGAIGSLALGMKAVSGKFTSVASLMLVSVALVALASAIVIISNTGIIGVATSFVALAGAMTIVGIATRVLKPLIPSMFSLAGSIAAFGGSLVVLGIGTAAVGTGLAVMMTALAAGIAALVLIDPMKAGQGLLILAGAFVTIGVAAKLLKPMIGSILQLSASLLSFSLSCAAVSISIAVLVSALTALGSIGSEGAAMIVETLKQLILGITEMIPELIGNLMDSFKAVILGLLDVLVEIAPQIAKSIFEILSQTIQSSLEYVPEIAGFFIDFLIQMINTVRERLPELVPAVTGLIGDLITQIQTALSSWTSSGNSIENGIAIFTALTGLVVIINYIKSMIPGAMIGLLELAAFVVEFGAILTAIGALEQLTGASSFINSAGDLFQSIGTAIGQFVGGIVGGFAEGATSTLPQVGTNLSQFAVNVMPFLMAMSTVDQSVIDGVTNLALAIAALSGANFIDAVTSFLSGGQDFGDLGAKLIPFGQAMVQFSNVVSGIDVDAINASAACGQALAALASSLPKEGGLAQAIFGESVDMGAFAVQIVAFGMALRMYATAVSGVDFGPVQQSAVAGQALSDLAATLPKEGGLAQAIFGENVDMATFGSQMLLFGMALKMYAAQVQDLDVESIQASAQAGQALSDLASALPDEGGLAEWIFGGSDLSSFGTTLTSFGGALKDYAASTEEVDFERIRTATTAIKNLALMAQDAISMDMSGIENVKKLSELGQAVSGYWNSVSSIDMAALASSVTSLMSLRDLISSLVGLDTSGITSFSSALASLGQVSLDSLANAFSGASLSDQGFNLAQTFISGFSSGLQNLDASISTISTSLSTALQNGNISIRNSGIKFSTEFATGIYAGSSNAITETKHMIDTVIAALDGFDSNFRSAGLNLAYGFANGIRDGAFRAVIEARAMANAAAEAAAKALDEHSPSKVMYRIGDYAGLGFVNGLSGYAEKSAEYGARIANSLVESVSMISGAYDQMGDLDKANDVIKKLSKSLDDIAEKDEKNEKKQKLAESIGSIADSAQKIVDRKNDLKSIFELFTTKNIDFSTGFMKEMIDSSGAYAGIVSDVVKFTDEQIQALSDIYRNQDLVDLTESFTDKLVETMENVSSSGKKLKSVQRILKKTGLTFTNKFVQEVITSGGEYNEYIELMANMTNEQLQKIADTFEEANINEQIQKLIDNLSSNRGLAYSFDYSGRSLEDFVKKIKDFGLDIEDALSSVTSFADSVADGFSKMSTKSQTSVQEFTDNLEHNMTIASEWSKNVASVFNKISDYGYSQDFRNEILEGGFEKYGRIINEMAQMSKDQIIDVIETWNTANIYGNSLGEDFVESVTNMPSFTPYGYEMTTGISKGIEEGTSNVKATMDLLCSTLENTVTSYFGIHSPSTLMEQIGVYIIQGLSKGIDSTYNQLIDSFPLVQDAIELIRQLGDEGIDIKVTVTPVIDMDSFNEKMSILESEYGSVPSAGTLETVNTLNSLASQNGVNSTSKLEEAVTKLADKVDSIDPDKFGVTYQQNNYSPKALSTATIYRQTRNQISLMRDKSKV